ncbi:hypothetical protein U27_03899 [Candidatus Vecturithrix granuli]|uniref:Conserved hypothetical protein CHP02391 domain-containing protein n=1 Tax=Vecturithrix granuli TaxID=1499967 RepID=A0A081BX80_VECG1|nr:hypothetical protein U27_03899 [Candidatus Vecturithrix granuli]
MIKWFVSMSRILRDLRENALLAIEALQEGNFQELGFINGKMQNSYELLEDTFDSYNTRNGWSRGLEENLPYLEKHIRFGEEGDYRSILLKDIPMMEEKLDRSLLKYQRSINSKMQESTSEFLTTLFHPTVTHYALSQLVGGHYQEAVLNSVKAIMQMIRERAELDLDGEQLVTNVFSVKNPKLVFDTINTKTGENIQGGFMMILQGLVRGVRNPTAHGFENITKSEAMQYLVFASLLANKIENATKISKSEIDTMDNNIST